MDVESLKKILGKTAVLTSFLWLLKELSYIRGVKKFQMKIASGNVPEDVYVRRLSIHIADILSKKSFSNKQSDDIINGIRKARSFRDLKKYFWNETLSLIAKDYKKLSNKNRDKVANHVIGEHEFERQFKRVANHVANNKFK